jgi:hypothetical protein
LRPGERKKDFRVTAVQFAAGYLVEVAEGKEVSTREKKTACFLGETIWEDGI